MYTNHEAKENHSRRESCLLNVTYYKLWARKYFAYYIIGQSVESYRVGDTHKILNQALVVPRVRYIWKAMRKKPEIMARMDLGSSQRHGSAMANAMKVDLPNTIRNVMQANHQNGTPGIDKSHRVIHS